ncbi:hypothetical protein PDN28_14550 [Bacillus cereus]|uniref:hypothetical protein n=1 Tax=Bacillus cereus group TaxID=86661 RepID=UPI000CD888B6|nr:MULTISPECIES: hypothetical protein [Bacillus cereus group]MCU4844464.1 hypothetical protein [Bacillus cereus]MDA2267116.1 hypothetical protein [Bacillus cereus]MDC7777743.1 hypothetical protein [Bacillus cereus]
MLIKGKSIRNVDQYIGKLQKDKKYFIGVRITEELNDTLINLGFSEDLIVGQSLMPDVKFGPKSKFNSIGKEEPQKDLPKEEISWPLYRSWRDWHGNWHSGVSFITRKRYPRKLILPPSIFMVIVEEDGQKYVISNTSINTVETDKIVICHVINLFLEIFGYTEIFEEDFSSVQQTVTIPLNWEVLPQGVLPWEKAQTYIQPVFEKASKNKQYLVSSRLETIEGFKPDFRAIGINGYRGYIIYGFTEKNIYVFESAFYGNATYIFEGNWKEISHLTKAQILNQDLCKERLVHSANWETDIEKLLIS